LRVRTLVLCGVLAGAFAPQGLAVTPSERAAREAQMEAQLQVLKRRVVALALEQRRAEEEKSAVLTSLRAADDEVGKAQNAVEEAETEQQQLAAQLAEKESERAALAERLQTQRAALAELIRSAYAHGRHEQLKLLLAQDQVSDMVRALAYLRHVQADRAQRVEGLLTELEDLAALTAEVQKRQAALEDAAAEARSAVDALAAEREQRKKALAEMEASFRDRESRLAALGRDQRAVEALLADLRDALSDIPKQLDQDKPFASRRGELPLPVEGRVQWRFGAALPGGRVSEGVRFAAQRGAPVRVVAPGRVAYADWLKGFGLLLIVDHGEGWMSLYANNDALRASVGDWVQAGEVVARAGSSGGEPEPALYFELRRNGQPVDPRGWWR
jgi:septal ring factor EnvC (AmiA/AmiB activator)